MNGKHIVLDVESLECVGAHYIQHLNEFSLFVSNEADSSACWLHRRYTKICRLLVLTRAFIRTFCFRIFNEEQASDNQGSSSELNSHIYQLNYPVNFVVSLCWNKGVHIKLEMYSGLGYWVRSHRPSEDFSRISNFTSPDNRYRQVGIQAWKQH